MPGIIDPETMNVDDLPAVWSPVQWEQTSEDHAREVEEQARASLLASVDIPEAILRLLLNETACDTVYAPPDGYDSHQQGDWDDTLITFAFNRQVKLRNMKRSQDRLVMEYQFENLGWWRVTIESERMTLERI
jgi:hypothetical protein